MEIKIENTNGNTWLIIEKPGLRIDEDLTQLLFELVDLDADKVKYNGKDVSDGWVDKLAKLAEDVFEHRTRPFDSSSLITQLFTKLPEDIRNQLLTDLNEKRLD